MTLELSANAVLRIRQVGVQFSNGGEIWQDFTNNDAAIRIMIECYRFKVVRNKQTFLFICFCLPQSGGKGAAGQG